MARSGAQRRRPRPTNARSGGARARGRPAHEYSVAKDAMFFPQAAPPGEVDVRLPRARLRRRLRRLRGRGRRAAGSAILWSNARRLAALRSGTPRTRSRTATRPPTRSSPTPTAPRASRTRRSPPARRTSGRSPKDYDYMTLARERLRRQGRQAARRGERDPGAVTAARPAPRSPFPDAEAGPRARHGPHRPGAPDGREPEAHRALRRHQGHYARATTLYKGSRAPAEGLLLLQLARELRVPGPRDRARDQGRPAVCKLARGARSTQARQLISSIGRESAAPPSG